MIRLIRADMWRLLKTKSFWICGAAAVVLTTGNFALNLFANGDFADQFGVMMFEYGSNVFLYAAVFTALFLGTDYSDGVIRNKLAAGHSRRSVYLASLSVCSIGALSYFFASRVIMFITGICFGGKLGISVGDFTLRILIISFETVSVSSVFTLIGMLITSKPASVVVIVIAARVLMMGTQLGASMLALSEYNDETGEISEFDPFYVTESKRDILRIVCNTVPTGQTALLEASELESDLPDNAEFMPLYSIGFTALASVIGTVVFKRKDLK